MHTLSKLIAAAAMVALVAGSASAHGSFHGGGGHGGYCHGYGGYGHHYYGGYGFYAQPSYGEGSCSEGYHFGGDGRCYPNG